MVRLEHSVVIVLAQRSRTTSSEAVRPGAPIQAPFDGGRRPVTVVNRMRPIVWRTSAVRMP